MVQGIPDDLKHPDDVPVDAEGALAALIARMEMLEEELRRVRESVTAVMTALQRRKARS